MRVLIVFTTLAVFFKEGLCTPVCDKVCQCNKDFTLVDCSRIKSNIVPPVDMWPKTATDLDLSFNFIKEVDIEMTHDKLTSLTLSNNMINTINDSVFGGLRNLKSLDLSNNEIEELNVETFYGLENLVVLNLKSNKIKKLVQNVFFNLLDIEELILSSNPFSFLEKAHFHSNIKLKKLEIANTGAYALPFDLFSGTSRLEYLDLSDNGFHEVPIDALRSAKNLKWLQISKNPIKELNQKSFRQLASLEILQINFMPELEKVDEHTFSDLQSLKQLDMTVNKKLSYIDGNAFLGLFNDSNPNLKSLDLSLNHLSKFMSFPCDSMEKLNLQNNPWICDCYLRWLRKCYIPEIYAADLKCNGPGKLKDKLLITIPAEDFLCERYSAEVQEMIHHNRVLRALSLAFTCIVIIMLAALVIFVLKFRSIKEWYKNRKRGPGAVYYVRAKTLPVEP